MTFTAFVAATLAGALACIGTQALPQAAIARLARSPEASVNAIGLGNARALQADTTAIRQSVRRALHNVPYRLDVATWSGPLALTGTGTATGTGTGAGQQAEVATAAQVAANAVLTAGTWPRRAGSGRDIPAAVPAALAARLGAVPGPGIAEIADQVLRLEDGRLVSHDNERGRAST